MADVIIQWTSDTGPSLFRVKTRDVEANVEGGGYFDVYIAIPSVSKTKALEAARNLIHSPDWWNRRLVISVERIGCLWALECEAPCPTPQ